MNNWTPEQLDAIKKSGTNIIVSAGAGSGKTAVLSERVIEKIINGTHINELLILTFTNAAASEMKDRIRKKISKNKDLKHELDLLTSSYITTFDSFALSVLRKYHYVLNISNNISITDESIVKIEESKILDNIFEELYKEKNEKFLNLIDNYCVKNDRRLRSNILSIARNINSNINGLDYIKHIKEEYFSDNNISRILSDYDLLIQNKKKVIKMELDNLSYYFDNDYIIKLEESIHELMNCNTNDLHLFTSVNIPSVPRGTSEEGKEEKKIFKGRVDDLLSYSVYKDYESIKASIISNKDNVYTILDIVEKFIFELNKYKKENNIYTFNDVAFLSIKILKENESIRNELRDSFKEIMIDEYQDTNDIQDTFISLISNNNVYMVGDIKQSIYKFRGSNPDIFKSKYESYSKHDGGIKIDLIKNFRSRNEVVNNINNIFDLIMDSNIGGAMYKLSHRMVFGNYDYEIEKLSDFNYDAEILEYENSDKEYFDYEIEIFTIVNDIKNKLKNNLMVFDKDSKKLRKATYNDFVIILDRSKYFNDYKKVFEYMGIPLTILRDETLNTNNDVLLLKNLIDAVIKINNNDLTNDFRYDFMSIARSFLYEYSDEEIFKIFKDNSFKETSIYKDLSKINNINSMTPVEVFESILDITKFYSKINKVGDAKEIDIRLNSLYNISSNINELGFDINEFVDYLNNIIEDGIDIKYSAFSTGNDSVKIMTTHKSKGLEYPICYYTDLDHKFNTSELKEDFIVSSNYGLIVPYEDEMSVLKELYKSEFMKEEIGERLRLFYVALTRAREKIIIVLPYKDSKKRELNDDGVIEEIRRLDISSLSDYVYYIKEYLPSYFKSIDIGKLSLSKNYLFNKKIESNIESTNNEFIVNEINIEEEMIEEEHFSKEVNNIISKNEYDVMKYGTFVHELLEFIDFKNINLSNIKDEFIKNKISILLNSKILNNIKDAKIYKEYEFKYIKDKNEYNGIIDLMLEYTDHIDIVDYKLKNVDDLKYIKQLTGYKNYIMMKSKKKVNLYLYSIMDEIIKEV